MPRARLPGEPGDADHHEFVEVAARDRQEAQPFEQRIARVLGLREHAAVERQPAQLAVEIALLRARPVGRGGGRAQRCSSLPVRSLDGCHLRRVLSGFCYSAASESLTAARRCARSR